MVMRIDIDGTTDAHEALARAQGRKRVGRKHLHKPSLKVVERRRRSAARRQVIASGKRRKWGEMVAAYWRGEIECYPSA
jgi:hypothetical protein